jgi:hypothetical protein
LVRLDEGFPFEASLATEAASLGPSLLLSMVPVIPLLLIGISQVPLILVDSFLDELWSLLVLPMFILPSFVLLLVSYEII